MTHKRSRIDPRALRHAIAGRQGRKRLSPRGLGVNSATLDSVVLAQDEIELDELELIVIDEPAGYVIVVPDLPDGRFSSHDLDMLGAARQVANQHHLAVLAVLFKRSKDDIQLAGIDRVLRVSLPDGQGYEPELKAAAVHSVAKKYQARYLLFPETLLGGADLGRRTAMLMDERPACHVWKLDGEKCISRIQNGSKDLTRTLPTVILVTKEVADPVTGVRHEARIENKIETSDVDISIMDGGVVEGGMVNVDPDRVPLSEAAFIVSAGNGVTDWTCFHRLSKTLRAVEGGSRVVTDNGHLAREKQIGATGTIVTANAYLALGISGAPQHLQGIVQCNHVIAVNLDAACDMVKRANLSIIANAQDVMRELVQMADEAMR